LSERQRKSYNWRASLNNTGEEIMKPLRVKPALTACLLALCSYGLISFPLEASRARTANPKPRYNVLFIIADDLRPELGSYGNTVIKTPNIDGLAARGTRFDRAYAQYPLCNPSRSSLLNGRYPTQTGVMDNNTYFRVKHPDYVTLPQYFKANGYATLRTGKIFHGGIDDEPSWTEGGEPTDPAITERGNSARARANARRPSAIAERDPDDTAAATQPQTTSGGGHGDASDRIVVLEGNGESHGDYKTATRAIEYLERYREKPFFLAVGFVKPHSPPTAPKKFFDLYDTSKITLPPDFATRPQAPPGFPEISIPKRNSDLFIGRDASETEAREMIRAYYASTSFVDAQVGRVLEALERLNLRDKTIVVFWGDHGYHLGEKGKWSKAYSLYEVGTRVPLIIAPPGAKAHTSSRTVELLDLYPTLLELCGLPKAQGIEGHSLVPLLNNPNARWDYPAFTVTVYQGVLGKSVRTERWHYAEWDEGRAGAMLFDHNKDPHELKNLAQDPAYAKTVQEMKRLLVRLPATTARAALP
jgi:arylsulfatase A-like enzyme